MGIKRGVSLYSYQQEQFFGRMNWKDMIREVHDNLHADGIEIIDEATIRHYPFPSEEFIFDWNSYMARYNMKATTMDIYMDVHQFRDHVMTHAEAAERLKNDIKIAARLGFENVRCLCMVPIDVIEAAIPTAEKYNVRIGKEIHAPLPIKPGQKPVQDAMMDPRMVDQIIELVERTGTKHVGLVPDFGIFQFQPTDLSIAYHKRNMNPDLIDYIVELSKADCPRPEIFAKISEKYPDHRFNMMSLSAVALNGSSAKPEDIKDIVPYIVSIHGKFYHMTEIEGKPGQYEDKSIDYATPIKYLKEMGFNGYIDSEFEGQRYCQDGEEYMIDEVEQVRRHHEMLTRLIGE